MTGTDAREREATMPGARRVFPPVPRVSSMGFLRSLLTIGCLWLPLILLQTQSHGGAVVWIIRFGDLTVGIFWWVKFVGRLEDAGWWSTQLGRGVSLVSGALAIGMLRRISGLPARSYYLFVITHFVSILPPWLRPTNGYVMLGLFLAIQVPFAFLPTNPRPEYPTIPPYTKSQVGKQLGKFAERVRESRKKSKRKPLGPLPFLSAILFIGVLWLPIIYMDSASKGGMSTWISRFGYFVLGFLWLGCASARIQDAGSRNPNTDLWQFCLVVTVASLMPLGLHWVNGYGALALFVLIQTPLVFLRGNAIGKQSASSTETRSES